MASQDLFDGIRVGANMLRNRIVMAPLTRNRAGEGGVPTALNATYYQQRASAGMILSEATCISPQGIGYPATPGIYNSEQVNGWRLVTDAVHEKGGLMFCQLWHVGRISHPSLQPGGQAPVAPSAIRPDGNAVTYEGMQSFVTPRALRIDELPGIVKDYVNSAMNAMSAGFDGVEIHAANGYLLDQFIRDGSNHRDDNYGGPLENRIRLLREVMSAVCEAVGPNRVGVRISPENSFNSMSDSSSLDTFGHVVGMLDEFGLAYLHVLEGDMLTGQRLLNYRQLRDMFNGPYMANCGYDLQKAQAAVSNGDTDLVSFGKLYIANPDLVERFSSGAPLNAPDAGTFYGGDERGYTDYPPLA